MLAPTPASRSCTHARGAPAAAHTAPAHSCAGRRLTPPQTGPSAAGCPVRPPAALPVRTRRGGVSGRPCSGHPGITGDCYGYGLGVSR